MPGFGRSEPGPGSSHGSGGGNFFFFFFFFFFSFVVLTFSLTRKVLPIIHEWMMLKIIMIMTIIDSCIPLYIYSLIK